MSGFWSSETLAERLPELIDPFDQSRIENCAYELSMGDQSYVTSSDDNQTRVCVRLDEGVLVNILPGQLAHLLIHECVAIPDDAVGLLSMKSKFKMSGLVNVSGFHVDPGYEGRLVFAVFNAGSVPIVVKQQEPVFLLWYVSLDSPTEDLYRGSRHKSKDIDQDQIMRLKGPTYNPTALAERVSRLERHQDWWRNISLAIIAGLVLLVISLISGAVLDVISVEIGRSSGTSGMLRIGQFGLLSEISSSVLPLTLQG